MKLEDLSKPELERRIASLDRVSQDGSGTEDLREAAHLERERLARILAAKQTVKRVAVAALAVLAFVFAFHRAEPVRVEAAQQAQIEKSCPQGTTVLPFTQTVNAGTGKLRQSFCVDNFGNITANVETLQQGGSAAAILPVNLAGGAGTVTGTLPGTNMAATNLAASGNGGVSGVLPVANEGTGTPAAGKYVDGATGAWTVVPAGGGTSYTGELDRATSECRPDYFGDAKRQRFLPLLVRDCHNPSGHH